MWAPSRSSCRAGNLPGLRVKMRTRWPRPNSCRARAPPCLPVAPVTRKVRARISYRVPRGRSLWASLPRLPISQARGFACPPFADMTLEGYEPQPRRTDDGLRPRLDTELVQDGVHVKLRGVLGDAEPRRDGFVGKPLREEQEDLLLAGGERLTLCQLGRLQVAARGTGRARLAPPPRRPRRPNLPGLRPPRHDPAGPGPERLSRLALVGRERQHPGAGLAPSLEDEPRSSPRTPGPTAGPRPRCSHAPHRAARLPRGRELHPRCHRAGARSAPRILRTHQAAEAAPWTRN